MKNRNNWMFARRSFAALALVLLLALPAVASDAKFRQSEPAAVIGRYVVTLSDLAAGEDPAAVATGLARTYAGRIEPFAEEGFSGFVIVMPAARARLLSNDPRVALVAETAPGEEQQTTAAPPSPRALPAQSLGGRVATEWTLGTTLWDSGTYVYDAAANITAIGNDAYLYDKAGRLLNGTAHTPAHQRSQQFQYDRWGNLLEVTTTVIPAAGGTPSVSTTTNSVNEQTNQLAAPVTYDDAGNQKTVVAGNATVTYRWDELGMMTSRFDGLATQQYVYDANDERIAIVGALRTSYSLRSLDKKVSRDFVHDSSGWRVDRDYVFGAGVLLAGFHGGAAATTATRHFHVDHLGTPRLVTDAGGAKVATHTYYAFGSEVPSGEFDGERLKFTGHERDLAGDPATELDYMHARYYGPGVGRFLSVDPVLGKAGSPQSWNRYVYANDNPLKFLDSNGQAAASFTGFSGGNATSAMIPLANALDRAGDVGRSRVFNSEDYDDAAEFLMAEYKQNPSQPIVLLGHSWGGDAALRTAATLSDHGIPVDILITFDAHGKWNDFDLYGREDLAVPPNVRLAINYYQTDGALGDMRLVPGSPDAVLQQIFNVEVQGTSHEDMDNALWRDVLRVITTVF